LPIIHRLMPFATSVIGVKKMLDRRSDREIMREAQEASATRFGQLATATRDVLDALRAYTHLVQSLVVVSIIAIVAAFLWPNFLQARHAAYVTTCLVKLNQLGLAMDMYRIDYGDYPPAETWHVALGKHLGDFETETDPLGQRLGDFEGEDVDPFKCPLDHSADPTSYFYVPDWALPERQGDWSPTDMPMLVDESYHPAKTTILWYDGHQTAVDKLDWIKMRREEYEIRRDPEHPEWFFFVPSPAPVSEPEAQP